MWTFFASVEEDNIEVEQGEKTTLAALVALDALVVALAAVLSPEFFVAEFLQRLVWLWYA
jgi:hypothetical protein